MAEDIIRRGAERLGRRLDWILLAIVGLLLVCAVLAQPGWSLLAGFWQIQISETGLITDPVATGGLGGALLNAALVLLLSTLLVRWMKLPVTGAAFACLFLMAGFAMLGKNLLNIAPIVAGGWLHALYKRESFAKYVYLTLYGTCLSPMVSFLMVHTRPGFRWLAMALCGLAIGFLLPAIARFTTRVHQGYNLYNVGFAAGILGLGIASVFKGFGVEFVSVGSWSQSGHGLLCGMMVVLLSGLFACGVLLGCRSPGAYRRVLRHSGRAVADFIILDGPGIALVNMALVGSVGLAYLLMLYGQGVRLNGPLVCCLFAMTGFGAFGKHPRNILPVMGGAVLAALLMVKVPITSPGVLLATLLCTCLAPIAGQFGGYWGAAAGFLHMTIVQNTSILHGGMNLYNNGFAAGLVCILMVPIIEAVKPEPDEE
ncbi:MAG: DUF1576 domain-containing protein [Oscillospiraceae bacterium]|nr:DUF1576 domain-containing protein [Oscillospiraceae bacterium]MDE6936413.1 DUF1576 domain-containing protein [Oscillospiraceae bacterium]